MGGRAVLILAIRNLVRNVRTPMLIAMSLVQPIVWLVFFSQTFSGLADTPQLRSLGITSYLSYFLPGMVVLSILFTALTSAMGTISDIDSGVLDKFLISPIPRTSILLGRVLADAVTMLAQGALVLIVALLLGARIKAGLAGAVGILGLATVLGMLWASLANLVALRTKSSELTMVTGLLLTLPAIFLSSAFLPSPMLPDWLRRVADWNPAAYVIGTGQQLMFGRNDWAQDLRTLAVLGVAAVVLLPASVAAFRAATR
jgi:ABC-2 type transport system permease protein